MVSERRADFQIQITLGSKQAFEYQKALLAILSKIEIGNCEPFMKEHVKKVYDLLGKLNAESLRISKSEADASKPEARTSNINRTTP